MHLQILDNDQSLRLLTKKVLIRLEERKLIERFLIYRNGRSIIVYNFNALHFNPILQLEIYIQPLRLIQVHFKNKSKFYQLGAHFSSVQSVIRTNKYNPTHEPLLQNPNLINKLLNRHIYLDCTRLTELYA